MGPAAITIEINWQCISNYLKGITNDRCFDSQQVHLHYCRLQRISNVRSINLGRFPSAAERLLNLNLRKVPMCLVLAVSYVLSFVKALKEDHDRKYTLFWTIPPGHCSIFLLWHRKIVFVPCSIRIWRGLRRSMKGLGHMLHFWDTFLFLFVTY